MAAYSNLEHVAYWPKADLNPVKVKVEATNAFNQVTFIDQAHVRGVLGEQKTLVWLVPARLRDKQAENGDCEPFR